ncbi:MAG TPA: autotransporter assembly complex family protein [Rhodanobacteraceae bacterium]|nr:autotransporter assembly complex family protein [Rhodanobacteraceae bacterium]
MAHAGITLHVKGLNDTLTAAVVSTVQLSQYKNHQVTEAQVRHLFAQAPDQVQAALRPYGYFDARVDGNIKQVGDDWDVTLDVDPGEPVRVTAVHIAVPDKAAKLPPVHHAIRRFKPDKGDILNQGQYTASRDAINAAIVANGFLDARMTRHRVAVTRVDHSAVVDLAWDAGRRYRFGEVHFKGSQFRPGFLKRYIPWKPGDYYKQNQLLDLQQQLNGADYFSVVNVEPDVEHKHDGIVDVDVDLKPAKRSVYTGGPFIGTDTGFGVQAGLERRWVNDRGHKWKNHLVLAQRLKMLSSLYSIPLPGGHQRAWNFGANFRDADTDTSHSKTLELVANQTWLWHGWLVTAGMHALSGTFTVGQRGNEPTSTPGIEHGNSTLVYPEISLVKKQGDNPTFVRHGWSLTVAARSTAGKLLSDANFSQLVANAKWIHAFNRRNRLLVRMDAGITRTNDFSALPPQLRFFAGGSRSNRGYGYQALGPRNRYDRVIGGTRLLAAGVTMEHYFTSKWGMAAFVDAGNAFNGTDFRPRIGAGLGLRWLSPVGMIRLDLGTPIHNDRHSGIQLNIVIGPDL